MLPQPLAADLEPIVGGIADVRDLSGGCISHAARIATARGPRWFLKWGRSAEFDVGIFSAEAEALRALGSAHAVRVPAVIQVRDEDNGYNWLLLEWLEPGALSKHAWEKLGRGLASLHRQQAAEFGWHRSNFIGSLPQSNTLTSDWPSFWRDERILPQLELAARGAALNAEERGRIETLLGHVDELAAAGNEDGASLLHGDLWGGNIHGVADGDAALIDPSSYFGHREVDLAMATLFGGFDARFFAAYEEEWKLLAGWERRRMLYQLYYLLVHVNLFGRSYLSGTLSLVARLGF